MSEKDRLDWNDEADFDSLADEPIEGFADFDDMDDFADVAEDTPPADADDVADRRETQAVAAAEAEPDEPGKKSRTRKIGTRGRSISGLELGLVFTASVLVAAAGMGAAVLLAVGVNPVSLWQPETFLDWQAYTQLTTNPVNLLVVISAAVVLLTLLGSSAIARAAGRANTRTSGAEEMLEKITALRLENEPAWQDPDLKDYAPAATFAAETLGAWRLQLARQRHFTGLEGELHRLEKALADNSRVDLTGRFDSPAVGSLADQMIRYFDEREAMAREVADRRAGDEAESSEIARILQDARCWHDSGWRHVSQHGEALQQLAAALDEFAADLGAGDGAPDPSEAMAAFKVEFDQVCQAVDAASAPAETPTAELVQLVDRSSKLAFQIAMEVARLGPRGERLGPMSQALEDLTTEFRQLSDKFNGGGRQTPSAADSLARLAGKLADLEQKFQTPADDSAEQARTFGPVADQLATNLADIAGSFHPQAERLTHLGEKFSELVGTPFDASDLSGDPENPPAGLLSLEGRMPRFDTGESIHKPADVDPFAVTPPTSADGPARHGFSTGSRGPSTDIFGGGLDRNAAPDNEFQTSFGVDSNPFATDVPEPAPRVAPPEPLVAATPAVPEALATPATPATPASPAVTVDEPQLSDADEKVYDLDAFGAEPVADAGPGAEEEPDEPLVDSPDSDPIYELDAFGAEPLAAPEPAVAVEPEIPSAPAAPAPVAAEDNGLAKIYDLADFGAVRLDAPQDKVEAEEIYDLAEFGAVPLN